MEECKQSMDEFLNKYDDGKYLECIELLNALEQDNDIAENTIFQINGCVCQGLVCLSRNGNVDEITKKLKDICHQSVPFGYPHEGVPLDIELTALYNYFWWILACCEFDSVTKYLTIDPLWMSFKDITERMLGDIDLETSCNFVEDILHRCQKLLSLILFKQRQSLGIFLELLALIVFVILLSNKNDIDILMHVGVFIESILLHRKDYESLHLILTENNHEAKNVFKFGILFGNSKLAESDISRACDILTLIATCCTMIAPEITNCEDNYSLKTATLKPVNNYLKALKSWKKNDLERARGYLLDGFNASASIELATRYHLLLGQIYSNDGERQKAVEEFEKAIHIKGSNPIMYYFIGYEHGKMGFTDLMLTSYEKLLKMIREKQKTKRIAFILEKYIMDVVHEEEVTFAEAIYILAVAYALNERFEDATTAFEILLKPAHFESYLQCLSSKERLIKLPTTVQLLHEAATMNLLTENLEHCENLCRLALDRYPTCDKMNQDRLPDAYGRKDTDWIIRLIQLDLGIYDDNTPHYEDYVSFFEEDVIGLLLLSELQMKQNKEDARLTLNNALILLSKQVARIKRECNDSQQSQHWHPLLKALTAKTCLHLANLQIGVKPFSDVDKMFRRALSCNSGDKDVLLHFSKFLINSNKLNDAQKLYHTFIDKTSVLNVEHCQSLALRFLLDSHASPRDIQCLREELNIKR